MNKIGSRLWCLSLIAVLGSTFLIGCTNNYNGDGGVDIGDEELQQIMSKYDNLNYSYTGNPCTISLAHWDGIGENIERSVIEAMLQGFEIRYPTIKVNVDILSNYETTYPNRLAAGNVHDVFMMPDGDFPAWASMNKCVNLNPFINASDLLDTSAMYQSSLTRYRYNSTTGLPSEAGIQLALPKDIGPTVMYYNKDIFDEMGVSYPNDTEIMNIEDATVMWESLVKKSDNGTIQRYAVSDLSIEGLVWSAGGDFLNENRTAFPSDTTTVNGLKRGYQFLQDAYVTDCITPPSEFTAGYSGDTLFSQQRVACFIGLKANVTAFRNLSFNWDVCPVPAFDVNPSKNAWSGSVGYSIYNGGSHIEAAWKLVEYIASREGQDILSATGFQIPVYEDLSYDEDFLAREKAAGPENFEAFLTAAANQSYGTWQYRQDSRWKSLGYDATSELLFSSDPNTRITVDEFINRARTAVTQYL